jgi:hypothetical protein
VFQAVFGREGRTIASDVLQHHSGRVHGRSELQQAAMVERHENSEMNLLVNCGRKLLGFSHLLFGALTPVVGLVLLLVLAPGLALAQLETGEIRLTVTDRGCPENR